MKRDTQRSVIFFGSLLYTTFVFYAATWILDRPVQEDTLQIHATSTLLIAIFGVLQLPLNAIGIYFIVMNLNEAREQNKISRESNNRLILNQKPYLLFNLGEPDDEYLFKDTITAYPAEILVENIRGDALNLIARVEIDCKIDNTIANEGSIWLPTKNFTIRRNIFRLGDSPIEKVTLLHHSRHTKNMTSWKIYVSAKLHIEYNDVFGETISEIRTLKTSLSVRNG